MSHHRTTSYGYVSSAVALAAALLIAGCGDSGPTAPGDPERNIQEPGVSGQLGANTEYMDENLSEDAVTSSDQENHRYTFDAAVLSDAGVSLEAGEILLLHGRALRRISSVSESGGQVTVETSYATIPEAFEHAEIEWDQQMEFTTEALSHAALEFRGRSYPPTAVNGNTVSWEYEASPYTVRGELIANGSSAEVTIQAIKDLSTGDATAAFTGTGTIQAVRSNASIHVEDHETKAFDYSNRGLGGDLKLSIAAAGAGNVGLNFETPQAVIRFPFSIGPIPATLVIKAGMVTGLDVIGNSASVTAESDFSWGGDAGLSYDGTTVTTEASSTLAEPIVQGGSADLASAFGQSVSAQWGVVVPIIEVGLFGETVVPYIQPELYLRAFLTWGPVCQRIKVDYNVDGGMDLRLLGIQVAELAEERRIAGPWEMEHVQEGCDSGSRPSGSLAAPYEEIEFYPVSRRAGGASSGR